MVDRVIAHVHRGKAAQTFAANQPPHLPLRGRAAHKAEHDRETPMAPTDWSRPARTSCGWMTEVLTALLKNLEDVLLVGLRPGFLLLGDPLIGQKEDSFLRVFTEKNVSSSFSVLTPSLSECVGVGAHISVFVRSMIPYMQESR